MAAKAAFTSHEAYISSVPSEVQPLLRSIQAEVQALLPKATPIISYGIPAYRSTRVFFYFAAFKNHIGVYPPMTSDARLIEATTDFRNEKGNLRFPLTQPLPLELIGRIAQALATQYT